MDYFAYQQQKQHQQHQTADMWRLQQELELQQQQLLYYQHQQQHQQQQLEMARTSLHESHPVVVPTCNPLSRHSCNNMRRKKRVTFSEDAYLYPGEIVDDTEEHVNVRWYSKAELNEFKQERKDFVRDLKKCHFRLPLLTQQYPQYCLRGYEPYFSMEVNKATKYAREHVYHTVFTEQEQQWNDHAQATAHCDPVPPCVYNDVRMASLVERASDWNRSTALELGALDALECFALTHNAAASTPTSIDTGMSCDMPHEPQHSQEDLWEQQRPAAKQQVVVVDHMELYQHGVPGAYHALAHPLEKIPDRHQPNRIVSLSPSPEQVVMMDED
jgi:hypothetical protein